MNSKPIVVESIIDAKTFSDFAWFDLLRVQGRWRRPALFAAFFILLAILAFSRSGKVDQAPLLGGVLLVVGIGLPLVYFGGFFLSVRKQRRSFSGKEPSYRVELDETGIIVTKGSQKAQYAWGSITSAWRIRRSVCLYVDARHAFLIPLSDGDPLCRTAWELITQNVDASRIHNHR